ncbi:FAD-dependent oxidoreductase [Aquamicrobium sp. LC103]|uniref:FAD-dependent oxidoreductase n=1 Tax=Aquamicrobium sp. LC103 TaxID=1120658 RepID=UPI00063E9A9F|nr:FAD-dependent oxidoreductase [Aquamicrobium sp. LC103]
MSQMIREEHYDTIVVGAGASGIGAALGAARNGARTLLVDAGPGVGGELVSGINLLGMWSSNGERIVGGVGRDLLEECDRIGGYVGRLSDFRPIYYEAFDPEYMKFAITRLLARAGVELRLYTFAGEVVRDGGRVKGLLLINKQGKTLVRAKTFIDCSGDADLAIAAGAAHEAGDPATGAFQSITMVFRMIGVDTARLLDFMREQPENFAISEQAFSAIALPREEAIAGLHKQGQPKVTLSAQGPLLSKAIDDGEMFETSIVAFAPVSALRREVSVNSTKISNVDATDTRRMSDSYTELLDQALTCVRFMKARVPGFEGAEFSGLAPRIGIRETRRVIGETVLTGDDVRSARKRDESIAKGGHPIDVWVPGRGVHWEIIEGGGSYDIPFGCLIPKGLENVLVAGRCLSSSREGQSSARVMGTCLAMGQAAGTAAALTADSASGNVNFNELPVQRLRQRLADQGAIV